MKKNILTLCIVFSVFNTLTTLLSAGYLTLKIEKVTQQIQKHSIHPLYGLYEQKVLGCAPWDACRHKDN